MGTADDSDITNDEIDPVWTYRIGPVDVLRYDPKTDTPVISDVMAAARAGIKFSEGDWSELTNIESAVKNLAFEGAGFFPDPLNALISMGLTFLIDVVQPLEDLLGLVIGNPERMAGEVSKWERVAAALGPLAEETRKAANEGLIGWEGRTAEAARARLNDFADGIHGMANDVKLIQMALGLAQTVLEIAQEFVLGLITELVEWLIIEWLVAMAAAVETFGVSIQIAIIMTEIHSGIIFYRGVTFIADLTPILRRLKDFLGRVAPDGAHPLAGQIDDYLQDPMAGGSAAASMGVNSQSTEQLWKEWVSDPYRQSDKDIEQKLDKDR